MFLPLLSVINKSNKLKRECQGRYRYYDYYYCIGAFGNTIWNIALILRWRGTCT